MKRISNFGGLILAGNRGWVAVTLAAALFVTNLTPSFCLAADSVASPTIAKTNKSKDQKQIKPTVSKNRVARTC